MLPRRCLSLLSAAALSCVAIPVSAQDVAATARFRLNPVQPASPHSPFFIVEGPVLEPSSSPWLAGNLIIDYARSPLTLDIQDSVDGERAVPLVDDAFVAHVNAAAFLTRSISVDLSWSVAALQVGENEPVGIREFEAPGSGAIGDVRLGALHRGWFSDQIGHVAGIRGWAPTGNDDDYMSDDRFRFEVLAGIVANTPDLRFACNVFGSPLFATKESGERVGGGCAADFALSEQGPNIGAEIWGGALYIHPDLDAGSIVEYMGTLGQQAGPLRLSLGVGRGAGNAPGSSALRVLALIGIVPQHQTQPPPRPPSDDRDLDSIPNDSDACPDEAGPASDDRARHGCPSSDSDGDGVEDLTDACPRQRGAKQDDPAASGCPDRDNDRFVDKLDQCPDQPAPPYDDPAQPGCPRHAKISGDIIDLSPSLDPLSDSETSVDQIVLREVAFILRAMPKLTKVAVEVRLAVPDGQDEAAAADLAIERANAFVERLVRLGVERNRLDPVGALSPDRSDVRVLIVERADQPAPGP